MSERSLQEESTTTAGFKSVLTSLPIGEIKKGDNRLEINHKESVFQVLAEKYKEATGITITNDYELHIFHVDEILQWERTKEDVGPFFTSMLTQSYGDPLKRIASMLVTGRAHKNIVVIEVDDKRKLNEIQNDNLKFIIKSETIFID